MTVKRHVTSSWSRGRSYVCEGPSAAVMIHSGLWICNCINDHVRAVQDTARCLARHAAHGFLRNHTGFVAAIRVAPSVTDNARR